MPFWKGFYTHVDACTAWYVWVHNGTLPESLRGRYNSNPPLIPPAYDDLEIAGRHRLPEHRLPEYSLPAYSPPGIAPQPSGIDDAVTVHVQATATFCTPTSALCHAPATPSRISRAITPTPSHGPPVASTSNLRPQGRVPAIPWEEPAPQLQLSDDSGLEMSRYWVIISGKKPGVYGNLYVVHWTSCDPY